VLPHARTCLAALLGAVLLAALAAAAPQLSPSDELEAAKGLYREGHFGEAIVKLQAVVDKLPLVRDVAVRRIALADAYLHLALSYVAIDERSAARDALRGMLQADPGRTLSPDVYAPKVTTLFAEVVAEARAAAPPAVPAPVETEKKHRSRTPLLVAGGAVVAGGGVLLATSGGGEPTPQGFSNTSGSGGARIVWLSASPAQGSSVSLRLGGCPRGLTASCTNGINLAFSVTADAELRDVFLKVQLLQGSVPCLEGFSTDVGLPSFNLAAGVPMTVAVNPLIATTRCTAPYTTTALTAFLYSRAGAEVAVQGFAGGYRFTP
jgi:hypothetical protein